MSPDPETVGAGAGASADPRAVEARLRRRKRRLERLNPVEEPERYRQAFLEVIDLEAALHRPAGAGPTG